MKRHTWFSAVACLLAGLIWGLPRPGQSGREERRVIAKIDIPPGNGVQALEAVAKATGLTLHIGPGHMLMLKGQECPSPIVLHDVTREAAVRAVFATYSLGRCIIIDGQIHTRECCNDPPDLRQMTSRVYDIGFIYDACDEYVSQLRALESQLVKPAKPPQPAPGGSGGGFGIASRVPSPTDEEYLGRYFDRITDDKTDVVGRRLIFTGLPESHQQIQHVLDDLAASIHRKETHP